jgi:hypothetical protein
VPFSRHCVPSCAHRAGLHQKARGHSTGSLARRPKLLSLTWRADWVLACSSPDILQHPSPGGDINLHLNWQRVGIVASVLWAIVGVFLAEHILHSLTYGRLDTCIHTITDLSTCVQNFNKDLANAEDWRWGMIVLVALAPIPIAWLVVYGLIGMVRWIRRISN